MAHGVVMTPFLPLHRVGEGIVKMTRVRSLCVLLHLEQSHSPHKPVSLKDSRVNFRLGYKGLKA